MARLPDTGAPSVASSTPSQPAANAERILQHRLGQADHLSDVAARNGNERLAENAERMRLQAQQQYTERMQRLGVQPVVEPPAPVADDPATIPPQEPAVSVP
jgi:hypothetical protein